MDIRIKHIERDKAEYVEIGCHSVTDEVRDIEKYVSSLGGMITGYANGSETAVPLSSVYYFESVDDRCFIYCADTTYESRLRLYELENRLAGKSFVRISKSVILDLMKVTAVKPALNGRYSCMLSNGEEVIISRKYVDDVKRKLRGEDQNER